VADPLVVRLDREVLIIALHLDSTHDQSLLRSVLRPRVAEREELPFANRAPDAVLSESRAGSSGESHSRLLPVLAPASFALFSGTVIESRLGE
jgi:hypothetical protein